MVLTRENHTMQRGGYEAVALEKPLITSQWPLLREVFSRGTIHVDNSAESITAAVRQIQANLEAFREEMGKLRRARAPGFGAQGGALRPNCRERPPARSGA